jgi:hypothetical protein
MRDQKRENIARMVDDDGAVAFEGKRGIAL